MKRNENNYSEDHNKVLLEGFVEKVPEFHHKVFEEGIYVMTVSIPRLKSDSSDHILVDVSERLMDLSILKEGLPIRVEGQFRSFNKKDKETGKRASLQLAVFAREITVLEDTKGVNKVFLEGYLCKEPKFRKTPMGREICDMMVAVNRAYNKSDYLPTISWGRNARFTSNLKVGTGITLEGRLQSRVYTKHIGEEVIEKTAYEVSTSTVSVFYDPNDKKSEE